MTRQEFPRSVKLAAFERAKGHCEICTAELGPGNIEYDHVLPDWLGGKPTLENAQAVCKNCHKGKSRADKKTIAKAKRQGAAYKGARTPPRKPMAGSRASRWKRKLSGEVVER